MNKTVTRLRADMSERAVVSFVHTPWVPSPRPA